MRTFLSACILALLVNVSQAQLIHIVMDDDFENNLDVYSKAEVLALKYDTAEAYFKDCQLLFQECIDLALEDDTAMFMKAKEKYELQRIYYRNYEEQFRNRLFAWTSNIQINQNPFLNSSNIRSHYRDSVSTQFLDSIMTWDHHFAPSRSGQYYPYIEDVDADGVADYFDLEADFANSVIQNFDNFQGTMINALSSFIADRLKQESLNLALNSIFKTMTREDSLIVSNLFPKTFLYINTLLNDGTYYAADLVQLRQIINMDVTNLDQAFEENKEHIFPAFQEYPVASEIFSLTNKLLQINESHTAQEMLFNIYLPDSLDGHNFNSWLSFSKMLSRVVEKHDVTHLLDYDEVSLAGYIDVEDLVSPEKFDQRKVRYFYGLYYDELGNYPTWQSHLSQYFSNEGMAREMYQLIQPFKNTDLNFSYGKSDSNSLEKTLEAANSCFNFLRRLCAHPVVQESYNVHPKMFEVASHTIELTNAFRSKRYPEAINIMALYFVEYLGGHLKNLHSVTFLLEFYKIDNATDMRNLIESYALPIGSSSIKRNSKFNVALNAYGGLTGGYELAYGEQASQFKPNVGLTAPIGISTTFGNGHVTVFASILDLGSIVNQRLNNDTVSYSGLKFEQFFTPGAGLFYNFKSSPITIGGVYNYIPNLRTITYESGNAIITETHTSVSRINFSVLIDIPLFNIYNRK